MTDVVPYQTVAEALRGIPRGAYDYPFTDHSPRVESELDSLLSGEYRGSSNQAYWRLDWYSPAPTVASRPNRFVHPEYPRVLAVREYARLQSFPDDFRLRGGKHEAFDIVKNAVPPVLAGSFARVVRSHV